MGSNSAWFGLKQFAHSFTKVVVMPDVPTQATLVVLAGITVGAGVYKELAQMAELPQ